MVGEEVGQVPGAKCHVPGSQGDGLASKQIILTDCAVAMGLINAAEACTERSRSIVAGLGLCAALTFRLSSSPIRF